MVQDRLHRRRFLGGATMALVGTTGCIGGGGGQISSVEMGENLVVNLEDDHDIDQLQLISESGEGIATANVGEETKVELTGLFDTTFNDAIPMGTHRIVALDSEENQVGEAQVNYSPEVGLSDFSVDAESGHIGFTVQSEGDGPFYIRGADTEYVEKGQIEFVKPSYTGNPRTISIQLPQRRNGNIAAGISRGGIIVKDSLEYSTSEVENYIPLHRRYDATTELGEELSQAPSSAEPETTSVIRLSISTLPQEVSAAFDIKMSFSGIDGEIIRSQDNSSYGYRYHQILGYPQEAEVVSVEKVGSGEEYFL